MFGYQFTQGVRDVLLLARDESNRLGHEYIGTEHIVLGLTRATDATTTDMFRHLGVATDALRTQIDAVVTSGRPSGHANELPYTSRGKKALELSMEAAKELGHAEVDTDHVIIGLLREAKGIGGQVLMACGATEEAAWSATTAAHAAGLDAVTDTMRAAGVPKAAVKRITIEVHHADGTVTRRESDTTREAILFLLRS